MQALPRFLPEGCPGGRTAALIAPRAAAHSLFPCERGPRAGRGLSGDGPAAAGGSKEEDGSGVRVVWVWVSRTMSRRRHVAVPGLAAPAPKGAAGEGAGAWGWGSLDPWAVTVRLTSRPCSCLWRENQSLRDPEA